MKTLLMTAVLLFAGVASGDPVTVNLTPQTCTYHNPTTGVCSAIGNDGRLDIDYLSWNSLTASIVIDGVTYTGAGTLSRSYSDEPFYDTNGHVVYVTTVFGYHSRYISQGRAHYYLHWWTLDSGSLVLATACSNGIDDDGDGGIDADGGASANSGVPLGLPDVGCGDATSSTESPACQDGIDDDLDGGIDFDGGASANAGVALGPPDQQCLTPYRGHEVACGLGAELVLTVPVLMLLRGGRRRRG